MTNNKVYSIQYLRFLAAGSVTASHVVMEAHAFKLISVETYRWIDLFPWSFGVDLFFIISGFIMSDLLSRAGRSPRDTAEFMINRIIRVMPAYWFFTALMVASMLAFSGQIEKATISVSHLVASLFLVPWRNPDSGGIVPILGQGWTLSYEMLFYVVAAAAILAPKRRRHIIISAALAALLLAAYLAPAESVAREFLSYSVMLEFLLGVWLYRWHSGDLSLRRRMLLGLLGFALLLPAHALADLPRVVTHGLPSALIFIAVLRPNGEQCGAGRLAERIGDASYALYLSHPFVVNGLWLVSRPWFQGSAIAFTASALLASLLFALAFHQLVEARVSSALRKYAKRQRKTPEGRLLGARSALAA
jgi:peptidoglycan/LPS O-acetylase OafA/YrhL